MMKKSVEPFHNSKKNAQSKPADSGELLEGFDERRRAFLKKLLVSAAYVTPAVLSFSIADIEAGRRRRKRPTKKKRKKKRRRR